MKLMNSLEFKKWLSYLLLVVASILVFEIITNFSTIQQWFNRFFYYLSPFLAGAIIAYLLDIPRTKIEKILCLFKNSFIQKRHRGLSVLITFFLFTFLLSLTVRMIFPQISKNIVEFVQNFSSYYQNALELIGKLNADSLNTLGLGNSLEDYLISTLNKFYQNIRNNVLDIDFLWSSILKVLNLSKYVFNTIVALISSIYLLYESTKIKDYFKRIIKAFVKPSVTIILFKYLNKINMNLKKFIYYNVMDGIILGGISIVGLSIIGIKFAFLLGAFGGLANLIPYFGAIIGSIFTVIIVLITEGLDKAIVVAIFLFILQQIDGNVIKPKLFGDSFQLSPFLVIFSITLGGIYFGIFGIIVAIPMVSVLKNIIDDILEYRSIKKQDSIFKESKREPTL